MTNSHDVLHKIVTQKEKDRTVTNPVAANLKSEVTQAAKDRTITGTATVTQAAKDRTITGTATVTQAEKDRTITGTATVTQAEKDRTVTGNVTVVPSGDMARQHWYDRNPGSISKYYEYALPSHNWTTRFTYTVPNNRKAMHSVLGCTISDLMAVAGNLCGVSWDISIDGGVNYYRFSSAWSMSTTIFYPGITLTVNFNLLEGAILRMQTYSGDTILHSFKVWNLLTEFDE